MTRVRRGSNLPVPPHAHLSLLSLLTFGAESKRTTRKRPNTPTHVVYAYICYARVRGAGGPCWTVSAKSQPTPSSFSSPPRTGRSTTHASLRLVKGSRAESRSWFMRGVLLLMAEHFNDWDLQAVVRSCGSVAHPDPPEPAAAAAPRAEADASPPEPTTTTPPAAPAARATPPPPPVAVRGQERAPPPVAKASAALLYDLEYLDFDHKPFLLPVVAPSPRPRAGDDGREREVMISFPAGAASTSGMQQRASPPGRKPGARTPRPKRRYRTDAVRSNSINHRRA